MALATKCPHCNTIFRVAADQLKLRGGIVRCGNCKEVFDGNAALVDPTALQPQPVSPAAPIAVITPEPVSTTGNSADEEFKLDFDTSYDPFGILPKTVEVQELSKEDVAMPATSLDFDLDQDLDAPAMPAAQALPEPEPKPEPQPEHEPVPESAPEETPIAESELLIAAEDLYAAPVHADDERREPSFDWPEAASDAIPTDAHDLISATAHDLLPADTHDLIPADAQVEVIEALPAEPLDDADFVDVQTSSAASPAPAAPPPIGLTRASRVEVRDAAAEEEALAALALATPPAEAAPEPDPIDDPDLPTFVKQGMRRERSGKARRIALGAGSVLLLAGLLAQGLGTFRNQLAAQVPALKPALVGLCGAFGCRVDLPAQIDALSVEQGELQALAETTFSYASVLRNQSASAQAWPDLELTLNDANDKPVMRRVFLPRDYLPASVAVTQGFPARSEQALKINFELASLKASGYHIAVFYP